MARHPSRQWFYHINIAIRSLELYLGLCLSNDERRLNYYNLNFLSHFPQSQSYEKSNLWCRPRPCWCHGCWFVEHGLQGLICWRSQRCKFYHLSSGITNCRLFAHHSFSFHKRILVRIWAKTFVKVSSRTTPSRWLWRNVWFNNRIGFTAHSHFRSMLFRCWSLCFQLQRNALPWKTWEVLCWDWSKWSLVVLCNFGYFFDCYFQHLWCDSHKVY